MEIPDQVLNVLQQMVEQQQTGFTGASGSIDVSFGVLSGPAYLLTFGDNNGSPIASILENGVLRSEGPGFAFPQLNICNIASIELPEGASFCNPDGSLKVTLLPVPSPELTGCKADCERAIRTAFETAGPFLHVVNVSGKTFLAQVKHTGFGVTFLGGTPLDDCPIMVSHCAVDLIRIATIQK